MRSAGLSVVASAPENDDSLPSLLSVKGVMDVTGLSRSTAHALIRSGKLPAVRFGRRVMIDRRDLVRFIDAHRTGGER